MTIIRDIVWCAEGFLWSIVGTITVTASRFFLALGLYDLSKITMKFAIRQVLKAEIIFSDKVPPESDEFRNELKEVENDLLKAMENLEE